MALLHFDGFDTYKQSADLTTFEYSGANNATWGSATGRFGAAGITMTANTAFFTKSLPAAQTEIWVGVAIFCTNSGFPPIIELSSAIGMELTLGYDAANSWFYIAKGNNSTVQAHSAAISPVTGKWHFFELRALIGTTTGSAEFWYDGVQVITATNINTAGSAGTSYTKVSWGNAGSVGLNPPFAGVYDDVYVLSTSGAAPTGRLGDSRIDTLRPTSDATPNNGVMTGGSGGNHFSTVNEVAWDTTSFLTMTNTSGQEELFGFASLAVTPTAVTAIKVALVAEKSDAGAASLATIISSSLATATGATAALSTSWGRVADYYLTDPNTSAAFTGGGVNALKAGFKVP